MPIDPSIAMGVQAPKFDSPISALQQILGVQNLQRQNQLGGMQLQQQQADFDETNKLRQLLSSPQFDRNSPDAANQILGVAPVKGQAVLKGFQDLDKTKADIGKTTADTAKSQFENAHAKAQSFLDLVSGVKDQPSYDQALNLAKQQGVDVSKAPAAYDPAFVAQAGQSALTQQQRIEQAAKQQGFDIQKRGQDMTQQTALTTTGMNNATSRANTASNNATSVANNANTIAKDYKVAGLDANGNFSGGSDTMKGLVDAIGQGKVPESTALGRVPPGIKAQVLQQVMQQYPDYDPTNIQTKQKANKDFTTGSQGNAMRSFAVAGNHLDQLGTLVDALDNGNLQVINKIGNAFAQQTGSPAPTNFDAAKDVVSKEVVKAIVAGGGGVAERQELSNLMSKANSPAQLKGVISQYRNLMGAQHDALLQQRRAAGLPDSTLPNYSTVEAPAAGATSAAPAAAGGWTVKRVN